MHLIKDGKALSNLFREDERLAQEILPELVSRLIKASCGKNTNGCFPCGSAIFTPGSDGFTSGVPEGIKFVPSGDTIWEAGSNEKSLKKIKEDYLKRKEDPSILNKDLQSFVLVTSSILNLSKKVSLSVALTADKVFKRVDILDANDLSDWLSSHIEVSIWLLKRFGKKIDDYEITLLVDEWDYISNATNPSLPLDIFLCGNKSNARLFLDDLKQKDSGVFSLSSKYYGGNFVYVFLIAALMFSEDESLINRCVAVHSQQALNLVCSVCENKIVLIDFGDPDPRALSSKNTFLLCENQQSSSMELKMTEKGQFRKILTGIGLSEDDAVKYSFLSSYNPIALRRIMSVIPRVKAPSWSREKDKYMMIPLMLMDEIDMDSKLSIRAIKNLVGEDLDNYLFAWNRFSEFNDPPLFKYGHIYRIGCRFEAFDFVKVDVFLGIVAKAESLVKTLVVDPNATNLSTADFEAVNSLIQGLVLITEKSPNEQPHFDRFVYQLLLSTLKQIDLLENAKQFLPSLSELSPRGFLSFVRHALEENQGDFVAFLKRERNDRPNGTNAIYLLWALRKGLADKQHVIEAFECLLDVYYLLADSKEVADEAKDILSPVASMAGVIAMPFGEKTDFFFRYITGKDKALSEVLIRSLSANGPNSISVSKNATSYRMSNNDSQPCSYGDIFDAQKRAFNWLIVNGTNQESTIIGLFHAIHQNPFEQMKAEFEQAIDGTGRLSEEEKERVRIEALTTRENIKQFKDWHHLKAYIPLIDKLISKIEPEDLYLKYKYILVDDYFPLENPPIFGESSTMAEEKESRDRIREKVIKELVAQYGQCVIDKIIINCGDRAFAIWPMVFSASNDHERDISSMVTNKCETGLRFYLNNVDVRVVSATIEQYKDQDVIYKCLPVKKEIVSLIDGKEKERLFWESNNFYADMYSDIPNAFEKFLAFDPTKLLREMAFSSNIDYNRGIAVLRRIAELLSDERFESKISKETYEIQTIVSRMDAEWFNDELSACEFSLLPVLLSDTGDYPLGIKKYFWDNPTALANLLLSLAKDNKSLSEKSLSLKLYMDALLTMSDSCFVPKEYLIQRSEEIETWVREMLSNCDFAGNPKGSHLLLSAIVGVLSACPKIPGQEKWPTTEIADALEKIASECEIACSELARSFAISVQNRRGVRTVGNGDSEFRLSDEYLRYADAYEHSHPTVHMALKMIAENYQDTGERDKAWFDLKKY